jgi:hypothetical protein
MLRVIIFAHLPADSHDGAAKIVAITCSRVELDEKNRGAQNSARAISIAAPEDPTFISDLASIKR